MLQNCSKCISNIGSLTVYTNFISETYELERFSVNCHTDGMFCQFTYSVKTETLKGLIAI